LRKKCEHEAHPGYTPIAENAELTVKTTISCTFLVDRPVGFLIGQTAK
jgi:hypothetical protein